MYKAVLSSDSYLIHYNKNHSKANGQFTSGDGDGDGIANDHANQRKSQSSAGKNLQSTLDRNKKKLRTGKGLLLGSMGLTALTAVAGTMWEETEHPLAAAATIIAGVGDATMTVVGGIMASQASREIKQAANKVINEHYNAPLAEAYEELNR